MQESMKDQNGQVNLSSFGIMLSLSTGIRLGELCALKWSDFSIEDGEFRIQRTMQRLPVDQLPAVTTASEIPDTITSDLLISDKTVCNIVVDRAVADNNAVADNAETGLTGLTTVKKSAGGSRSRRTSVEIGAPKSHCSIRTIPIPEAIMPYIRSAYEAAHRAAHSLNGNGGNGGGDAFLLTGEAGRFIEPRTMENRFKAVLKKCGLRNINFHALRHSFATRAVELGFDVKTLSEDPRSRQCRNYTCRYVHPSMKVKKENMDKMGKIMLL